MAAHPFGPIEKQLIRAYTYRGYKPLEVRMKMGPKMNFKLPDMQTHPIWGVVDKFTFKQIEPAISTKSKSRFAIFPNLLNQDSLSRGLGYRITFTMPADKEFNIEQPDTYPLMQLSVLEYFGENVIGDMDNVDYFNDELYIWKPIFKLMVAAKCPSLEVMVNFPEVKITLGSEVFVLPLYMGQRAKSNLKLINRFGCLIEVNTGGLMDIGPSSMLKATSLLSRLRDFTGFLRERSQSLSQEAKLKMKDYLLDLLDCFVQCSTRLEQKTIPPVLREQLATLESDFECWLTKGGEYPKHFDSDFILRVCKLTIGATLTDTGVPLKGRILGIHPSVMNVVRSNIRSSFYRSLRTESGQTVVSVTKNFEIFLDQHQALYFRERFPQNKQPPKSYKWRKYAPIQAVIYERDLVFVQSEEQFHLVHLKRTQQLQDETGSDEKVCSTQVMLANPHACRLTWLQSGILFATGSNSNLELKFVPETLVATKAVVNPNQLPSIVFSSSDPNCDNDHGNGKFAIHKNNFRNEVLLAIWKSISDNYKENPRTHDHYVEHFAASISFAAVVHDDDKPEKFKLVNQTVLQLPKEFERNPSEMFWTEDVRGTPFLCLSLSHIVAYSYKPSLVTQPFVMVYHRRKFSPVTGEKRSRPGWLSLDVPTYELELVTLLGGGSPSLVHNRTWTDTHMRRWITARRILFK